MGTTKYALELNELELQTLVQVLVNISGSPAGLRGVCDRVLYKIEAFLGDDSIEAFEKSLPAGAVEGEISINHPIPN